MTNLQDATIAPSDKPTIPVTGPQEPTASASAIIQNNIVINNPPAPAAPRRRSGGQRQVAPAPSEPRMTTSYEITTGPDVQFAPDGDRITIYRSADGATATYIQDAQRRNEVTFILNDSNETITTRGSRRGYEAERRDVRGGESQQGTLTNFIPGSLFNLGVTDRLNCPAPQRDVNIIPDVTDSVTRQQIRDFANQHPGLARQLRNETLPVTMNGSNQVTFGEAMDTPSTYRSCPVAQPGQALERLR